LGSKTHTSGRTIFQGEDHNGTEARETCERLLAEYQQTQMAQQ